AGASACEGACACACACACAGVSGVTCEWRGNMRGQCAFVCVACACVLVVCVCIAGCCVRVTIPFGVVVFSGLRVRVMCVGGVRVCVVRVR
ncbi:hypothetical protein KI387_026890, partial [Taxus chinensis]